MFASIDDVGVASRTLTLTSVTRGGTTTQLNRALALDGQGQARLVLTEELIGTLKFDATATDVSGNIGNAAQREVVVLDPSDTTAPVVNLLPPLSSTVSVPTDLLGTITDDGTSITWTLEAVPVNADPHASKRLLAFGDTMHATATVLGLFDPTILANGSYAITLTATDEGGNSASDTEYVTVDGRLKLGNFALSFTDLEVPVAGIPITIRRTYDTLDAEKNGDFGYGWNLDVAHPTVDLVPGTQGRYPARVAGRSYPSMENGTEVIVTTPEGTEERFRFQWVEVGFGFWSNTNQFRPSFVPVGNNNYQLIAPGSGELFNQFYMNTDGSGYDYSPFAPYYGGFELKEIGRGTRGLTYQIFSDGETAKSVSDKYGNTLTYDTNQAGQIVGISSNRGRAVTINRDWSGRISTITDPAGHSLTYKYDSLGRLVSFYDRRATARLHDEDPTNDYQPTKFQYTLGTNPAFENIPGVENFLTTIIDPLGADALRANYDPNSGRLVSLVDADGNPASLSYDIAGLKVTSTSSSGTTQVSLDPSGNPIRSVDEQGNVTLTEYADPIKGLPSRITRVIGQPDTPAQIAAGTGDDLTTRYTYNQWGQRTSETDPRGNTSTTVYDNQGYPRQEIDSFGNVTTYAFFDGQLYGTTDTDGNSTSFSYDTFGNVNGVAQSNHKAGTSTSTSFVYNSFGDLIGTIDADGNTRTIHYDSLGRQTGTTFVWQDPLGILPNQTITTASVLGPDGNVDSSTDAQGQTSITLYDALGRAYQQIDSNGRASETVYDRRGLAIETRNEGVDEQGNSVTLVSRTVYDASGRAIYSTGSFPLGTNPAEITGTHTIYDVEGRVEKTQQLLGVDIQFVGQASNLSSVVASAGSVISFSASIYDDVGRVVETYSDTGLRSQTLYGQFGEVVESRSEVPPASGLPSEASSWMVSRTIYDSFGRAVVSTDRFLVPIDTPLGEDPVGGPVPTQVTKTIYDQRGRSIATERYAGAEVSLTQDNNLTYSPQPVLEETGTLESVSETLYDAAGRVWRTLSGRVPMSTLSGVALAQAQALASYPARGTAVDPYHSLNLSSGVISDTLFDARGRQYASLGHPLPAADVGLSGTNYDGKLVRPRTETIYDSLGSASIQRSGLAHVESNTGVFQGVYDNDSVDTKTYSDAFGNIYRSEFIIGGTIAYDTQTKSTTRTGGSVHSYTLTHYDAKNRPVAEMQAVAGNVTAVWSATENSFVIDSTSTHIPTKLYVYDTDDRLIAVELPAVANPLNSNAVERPRYEYGYNEQGNQTLIRDPLGRETRFTFTARGQQSARTLPFGFGADGIQGTSDDPTFTLPPGGPSFSEGRAGQTGAFTEGFTYDARGRQVLHVSFEGVVSENVYDNFGRLEHINYYADQASLAASTISERWSYQYDEHGRKSSAIHSANNGGTFTPDRMEETFYDDRGRVIAESSPEGVLAYTYDPQGRRTSTAVFAAGDDFQIDDPERVTSYGYDLLGRLVSVTEDTTPTNTSDDPQVQTDYTFDLTGRLDTATTRQPQSSSSRFVQTDYDYDALGRLDIQTDRDDSGNVLASYDYTVRADGKRTALEEKIWFDANENGEVDPGEQKATTYDWTYDAVGRLADEVIDHWDDQFDQTEKFIYDLTGNRRELTRDKGNNSINDAVITYVYDANDRLLEEALNDLTVANDDTMTAYGYDHTQQTSKSVASTSTLATRSSQLFTYNLQGRMSSVVNEGYTGGTLSSRERTSYEYDSKSYRAALVNEVDSALNNTYTLTSSTEFLAAHHNHTGYTQTIRETTTNADGTTKTIDYTFGLDEITQRVVERDDQGGITSDVTHVFGHDGHGSVRVLYDLAGAVAQAFTFAAYGQLLALHDTAGAALPATDALTSLGYSGEHFDAKAQQQYLRARWYNPANGQFNRLDPFAGNMQDPQSLHKYAYVHGDPIQYQDPSGLYPSFVSYLESWLLGTFVHSHIGRDFKAMGIPGTRWANQWIMTIASGIPGSIDLWPVPPFNLKPDLAEYVAGPNGIVYEIKPGEILQAWNPAYYLAQATSAQPQLLTYTSLLNIVTPPTWLYGAAYAPGVKSWPTFRLGLPSGWTLVTFNNYAIAPGVILYDFVPTTEAALVEGLTVAAAVAILSQRAAIAGAIKGIYGLAQAGASANGGRMQQAFASSMTVSFAFRIPI